MDSVLNSATSFQRHMAGQHGALTRWMSRLTTGIRWLLLILGLALFQMSLVDAGAATGLWLAPIGVGIALVAWVGQWAVVPLVADLLLTRLFLENHSLARALTDTLVVGTHLGASWWCYHTLGGGWRRLEEPRG